MSFYHSFHQGLLELGASIAVFSSALASFVWLRTVETGVPLFPQVIYLVKENYKKQYPVKTI
jgi:hypothetical protein